MPEVRNGKCVGCGKDINWTKDHQCDKKAHNNGGITDYWDVPEGASTLNDLIEHKKMSFAQACIFKAAYRLGDERHHSTVERDLNKIIYYANRMLNIVHKGEE